MIGSIKINKCFIAIHLVLITMLIICKSDTAVSIGKLTILNHPSSSVI